MTKTLSRPVELVKHLNARQEELLELLRDPRGLTPDEHLEAIEEQEAVLQLLARIGRVTA